MCCKGNIWHEYKVHCLCTYTIFDSKLAFYSKHKVFLPLNHVDIMPPSQSKNRVFPKAFFGVEKHFMCSVKLEGKISGRPVREFRNIEKIFQNHKAKSNYISTYYTQS